MLFFLSLSKVKQRVKCVKRLFHNLTFGFASKTACPKKNKKTISCPQVIVEQLEESFRLITVHWNSNVGGYLAVVNLDLSYIVLGTASCTVWGDTGAFQASTFPVSKSNCENFKFVRNPHKKSQASRKVWTRHRHVYFPASSTHVPTIVWFNQQFSFVKLA